MKKLSTILLGLSLLAGASLYAAGAHDHEHKATTETTDHMGDHMHEGKMTNHMNMDGMTDAEMKKNMNEKTETTDHMGNHMHEGKMTNHMNMDGMTDEEMKKNMKEK
jgi:hypothetical protein